MRSVLLSLIALLTLGACADATIDTVKKPAPIVQPDPQPDPNEPQDPNNPDEPELPQYPHYRGILVLGSDYISTSLSNLNAGTGLLLNEAFLTSGSTVPGLTTAISSDAALPSNPTTTGEIVLIDRFHSVLTWIDSQTLKVLRQMKVGEPSYGVNPNDYLELSAEKAYITRYDSVFDSNGNIIEGDDIYVVNPKTTSELGRIDLNGLAAPVPGATSYAKPNSLALIGDYVYVTLQSFTTGFSKAGEGRIAIIDTQTDEVAGTLNLPGTKNCGAVKHDPVEELVVIVCAGVFADGATEMLAKSAVVVLDVKNPQTPSILRTYKAQDFNNGPFQFNVGLLGENRVLVGTFNSTTNKDKAFILDISKEAGGLTEVFSTDSYSLSYFTDINNGRFYLGDANYSDPALHVYAYDVTTGSFEKEASIKFTTAQDPRELAGY